MVGGNVMYFEYIQPELCMGVRVYVCVYVCMFVLLCVYMLARISMWVWVCVCMCVCEHVAKYRRHTKCIPKQHINVHSICPSIQASA
jgi:hypothetical protein